MINYVIPPRQNLDLYELGSAGFFCLAQLYIKDENYRLFVRELKAQGVHILLDNGAGDHDSLSNKEVYELMHEIMPDIVVPLDTIFDAKATREQFDEFVGWMSDDGMTGKVQIMAVPQGNTRDEWLDSYKYFLKNSLVDIIGMSKIGVPHAWLNATDDKNIMEARHEAIEHLYMKRMLEKPLHFLGMGDPNEVVLYEGMSKANPSMRQVFRSTDSCNVIWSAMNGLDWSKGETERIKTPRNYFDRIVTEEQEELARINANTFNTLLNGTSTIQ